MATEGERCRSGQTCEVSYYGMPEFGSGCVRVGPLVRPIHVTPTLVKTAAHAMNGDSYTCKLEDFMAKIALEIVNTNTIVLITKARI